MAFRDWSKSEKWGMGLISAAGVLLVGGAIVYARGRKSRGFGAPQLLDHRVSPEGMQLKHYYDGTMPIKDRVKLIQNLVEESVKDPAMRELSLKITKSCPDRDGECEAKAIYDWVRNNIRYTGDVAPIKMKNGQVEGVDLFQTARRTVQFGGGDCFPHGTIVVTRNGFEEIQNLKVGDEIHDGERWVSVLKTWERGPKEILRFDLSNGRALRLSGNHKVLLVRANEIVEVRAEALQVGDVLLQPAKQVLEIVAHPGSVIQTITTETEQVDSYDIMTESGRVYLPKVDVITRQCDDHSILESTLLSLSGVPARLRITRTNGSGKDDWSHIYTLAGVPKTNPSKWIAVDSTLPSHMAKFGKEVPYGHKVDFPA